ncbi:PIG-L family deacetylase [Phenylobacterium sp.]|uniref:PIG-L family deacetylase n=1 Tax=Phenylobacterium sp. TaxID=1871053 RepID=UPI00272F0B2F|nr:PIG-L family deacetylase [Phenylobacterium sp.]MDP1617894.1 PIG-L family deacetylase [Phenylobacterium sp.]MDP1988625.1 PIG-L family deacetylase [Phenylobacterium sp.]
MTVVYILAHCDDEYAALPLILEAKAAGRDQVFLYVAENPGAAVAERRLGETRAFLASLGLPEEGATYAVSGAEAYDGQVHRRLDACLDQLRKRLAASPRVEKFVIAAWEGGHADHDACAALTAVLAAEYGAAIEQFGLYNRRGLSALPFQACAPIPENGPVRRIRLSLRQWLNWAMLVRRYPSQATSWLGLWPSMFAGFALRGGYGVQRLDPARLAERPHAGDLLYERRFGVAYAEVAEAVQGLMARELRPGSAPA